MKNPNNLVVIILKFHRELKELNIKPVTYTYDSWAPWNKEYSSAALLPKILESYKATYGGDFKVVNDRYQGKIYYRMDGKRRINLFIKDEQFVQAIFTDMEVEERLKNEFEKSQSQKPVN